MDINPHVLSVSELNCRIKALLDSDALLSNVYVRGEISNYKMYPSGHHYFTLKDEQGVLRCVMFRTNASLLKFRPEDGMKVIAQGRVAVFPRDGQYQLYCAELIPEGTGALFIAFEQLKEKLGKEGLFEQRFKKKLPLFPQKIALVTSPAGAAVRDMIRILGKRWPLAQVIIVPVRVQGAEAPGEICAGLKYADRQKLADVIITGRGGGSIEDLWAFNDENVARTIFACETPVISAVGHEPDFTIADFVADVRAATPSNAAEIAAPDITEISTRLNNQYQRAAQSISKMLTIIGQRLKGYKERRVLQSPIYYIQEKRMLLDFLHRRTATAAQKIFYGKRDRFTGLSASLEALSPLKVLARGYSIACKKDGEIIKDSSKAEIGENFCLKLQKGTLDCVVVGRST